MIAKNHEKIFETIQEDLIASLARAAQSDGAYPYALYLGNWMADFSQLCSPDLPNILIEILDLPDFLRTVAADALAFLDSQQKALPAIIAASLTKALMDKETLAKTARKVKASPYQNDELLNKYVEYLKAAPTPQVTPHNSSLFVTPSIELAQPPNNRTKKRNDDAYSSLLHIANQQVEKRKKAVPGSQQPDATVLVSTLVEYMLEPIFNELREILQGVNTAADFLDKYYLQAIEILGDVGFVDKFNGTAELLIWLLGLFKFSNPGNANAPEASSQSSVTPMSSLSATPSFGTTPQRPFVVAPSLATPLKIAGHIPPNDYSQLFAKYFGFYKPYEHLDRFMDVQRVSEAVGSGPDGATLDQKRKFRHYRKDNYSLIVTPIMSLKGEGLDLDATLWRNMQIAYGRLLALREASEKTLPINEKLLLIGRSFHVFEDYFAHTNFVDRLVYSMQLEHDFHTHPFELKKILLSVASEDAFNALKANASLFGNVDCANPDVKKIIETGATECVKSGFYDTPDTWHSLIHLFEGIVKHALEMEDEQRDSHFDLYEALEKYALHKLEELENGVQTIFFNKKTDLIDLLNMDRENIFLDEKSFAMIANSNPIIKSMGGNGNQIKIIINSIFWLILAYYAAINTKNAYVAVRSAISFFMTIMKIIKTLYFTPNVIVRYLKIAFLAVPEPIRDELIALAVEVFKEVCRMLASAVFGWIDKLIESKVRYGSHSLMAKDEDTHQGRLYALAEQFGILIDKAALEFVFPAPPTKSADPLAPTPPTPHEVLERLLDGIAYNPLTLKRDDLNCVSHGVWTRFSLESPERVIDTFLKNSVKAYLNEDKTFEEIPGFLMPALDWMVQARWAAAIRAMVKLNSLSIKLRYGKDPLYLSDATFELIRPMERVDLIVWKSSQTPALKRSIETTAQQWTVRFVNTFMEGNSIEWKDYSLSELTKSAPSGKRCIPEDYRTLADQYIRNYTDIWRNILVIPGTIGDNEWAITHDGKRLSGWV